MFRTSCGVLFISALAASPVLLQAQSPQWNPKSAAAYLDGRLAWWEDWPSAQRDHQTFCVSCHTSGPYAIARPSLQSAVAAPPADRRLIDNIVKRVRMWNEVEPFYPTKKENDPKTVESRGTEAVFNALILARRDDAGSLSPDARTALDNMWSEQIASGDLAGAFPWLQFHNAPFEGDSQFYGSTLAALAAGSAPREYRDSEKVRPHVAALNAYLSRNESAQVLINRATLLWASAKLPGLLKREQQDGIRAAIFAKQQADGGFSLSNCIGDWKRRDNTPLESRSDGYATGLIAYALEQAGATRTEPHLKRAIEWLSSNQRPDGGWDAWSLNIQRDPASDRGRFMSDAATAYAALALTSAQ